MGNIILSILTKIAPVFTVIVILAIVIAIIVGISKTMYKKAPPNTAMVITGPRGCRTAIGKGCFVIPIIQRVDYLSLENIQSDFTSRDEIPTSDAINILVDAVANVSISQNPERLKIAASKFLGYRPDQIKEIITPVFEGNIREIISQTTLKELIQGDKKAFAEKVIDNVTPNLNDMGLDLTTFNIQNFKDRNGVIENLGLENTVQISKDAAISKAKAEKEIAVAKAEAAQAANDAKVKADLEIAKKQNELSIQKAELQKEADTKKAEADAAYQIQQEEQRKTIEITTANANLAKQEKEIELKERAVAIKERTLEAEVKKEAEARKYAAQQDADAKLYEIQKASEAELFERQKKAEAEKFEAKKQAECDMQTLIDAITEAKLERTKKEDATQLEYEKAKANIEKAKQEAYAETVSKIVTAIGPDLVAALTSTSNASMLETVTKSMAPYAIARGNESVAEVTDRLLRGTNLEKLIENLGKVKE